MIFGFIVLSNSLASLADLKKCLFLNDEPCIFRPTIIDINSVKLKYYPLMTGLNKCTGSRTKNMCSKRNKIHVC